MRFTKLFITCVPVKSSNLFVVGSSILIKQFEALLPLLFKQKRQISFKSKIGSIYYLNYSCMFTSVVPTSAVNNLALSLAR